MPSDRADDAERAVLGALLIDNALLPAVAEQLTARDFRVPSHAHIYRVIADLLEVGSPADLVTVIHALQATGRLDACGGASAVTALVDGVPRSINAPFYARMVARACYRRRLGAFGERLREQAGNGVSDLDLETAIREFLETQSSKEPVDALELGLTTASAQTEWLADGLIPRGELVVLAATWKTAKTLITYRLVLDLLAGRPVWGRFHVERPARVSVFQLEMPPSEDRRRLLRLCRGIGDDPAVVESNPALRWYSRPALDFTASPDIARFQRIVEANSSDLVVIDSALAAFAGSDLNDNSEVRRLLARAFLPITSRGCAVLILHHYRKAAQGGRDDGKSQVLGAQAFGAAAGRVYGLERLAARKEDARGTFRLRLSMPGGWAPGEDRDQTLGVEDTADGQGTLVAILDEQAQLEHGGLTKLQQAALNIKNRVINRRRIGQEDALVGCEGAIGCTRATARRGLAFAIFKGWVRQVASIDRPKTKDLIPPDEAPEPPLLEP